MNFRKFLLTATASLLTVSSLIGCGAKELPTLSGEEVGCLNEIMPLAYKYGAAEKELLAADGVFCDFEGYAEGAKYKADDETVFTEDIFTFRPKKSSFEIVSSEDGRALRFERSASSASANTDPHIDVEILNKIPAKTDMVAEFDVMPMTDGGKMEFLQIIYRPSTGRINSAGLLYENGELKLDGKKIADVPKGEFTKIACVFHQSAGIIDVYVNGYMVDYSVPYLKAADIGYAPHQIRLIRSGNGECSALVDNVAAYRGSEPKYISKVSESDIKLVREYRFEGAEGAYAGENGFTVKKEKSTYNIIKTPDGHSVLKHSVGGSESMVLSTEGSEAIRCFSAEVYLTSDKTDYTLAAFFGVEWTSVLEIRGTTLWNALDERAVYDLGKNRWAKIDLFIDGVKNTCSIYVNGYRYVDGAPISTSVLTKMNSIRIGATSTPESPYSVYLDNLRFYNATGVLGYKGMATHGMETVYTVASPADFSAMKNDKAGELTITDAVKGSGDTTALLTGFTTRVNIALGNCGLAKQVTGDYDFTNIDAIRIRYYSPKNAGRTFVLIFDCGNVYKDLSKGTLYYDGSWKKGSDGSYTCDKYPGVKAEQQWSYYNYMLTLDSEGWATVTVPLTSFASTRLPDWTHVEAIRLECQGWNLETNQNATTILPDSKAEYYFDTVELITYG